jgi:hypothetical protein
VDLAVRREYYEPDTPPYTSPGNLYRTARHYGAPWQGWAPLNNDTQAQELLRTLLSLDLPVVVDVTTTIGITGIGTQDKHTEEELYAHFVVVTGIDTNGTVTINDPYGGGEGAENLTVSWPDFYWAWSNNDDGIYGGHGWWMVVPPDRK